MVTTDQELLHQLKRIIETDGILKIQQAINAVVGNAVDVSDRPSRQVGVVYGDNAGTPTKVAVDGSGKLRVVTL